MSNEFPENEFGFTKDVGHIALATAYREAAVADGWSCAQISNEPIERWAKLSKDGYVMHVMARKLEGNRKWAAEVQVCIWGPDGMVIKPPDTYDWQKITAGLRHCNNCDADDVDTQRYSFAGRCCAKCIDEMRRTHERPGWTN